MDPGSAAPARLPRCIATCENLPTVPGVGGVVGPAGAVVGKLHLGVIHPSEVTVLVLVWHAPEREER